MPPNLESLFLINSIIYLLVCLFGGGIVRFYCLVGLNLTSWLKQSFCSTSTAARITDTCLPDHTVPFSISPHLPSTASSFHWIFHLVSSYLLSSPHVTNMLLRTVLKFALSMLYPHLTSHNSITHMDYSPVVWLRDSCRAHPPAPNLLPLVSFIHALYASTT